MKTVFVAIVRRYSQKTAIDYSPDFENLGIFSTREKAEKVAAKRNDAFSDGFVVEVEIDRETMF